MALIIMASALAATSRPALGQAQPFVATLQAALAPPTASSIESLLAPEATGVDCRKDGSAACLDGGKSMCCLGCCCDDPCHHWEISAGALFLKRSDPSRKILFQNFDPVVGEALDTGQFDFGFEPGFEIGLTRHDVLWSMDLEAKFWQVDDWSSTASAAISSDPLQINTTPLSFIRGPRSVTSIYSSEIRSFELNLRHRSALRPRWEWLIGYRMLELDEDLNNLFGGGIGPQFYRVNTRNRLYGAQIGGDLDLFNNCCWCLRGFVRAGLYDNQSHHGSVADCFADPDLVRIRDSDSRVAFLGETGLSAKYCIGEHIALRADYRAVWIDGVALASDQIGASSLLTFGGMDSDGSVFYHGLYLGVDVSF